jgi:hypothetical protein
MTLQRFMSIQEFTFHFNLLRQEGSIFMSLGGQFYMSPDTVSEDYTSDTGSKTGMS